VPEQQLAPNQLRLDPRAQDDLEGVGHAIRYPRGSILFGEGEETDFALLIRKGYVKITVGSKERIVAIRGPEEVVGELAAIEEQPRSASVYAMTDVEALYVSGSEWRKFLDDHVAVMHSLVLLLAHRLRESTRKQAESGFLALERRVAMSLLELASLMGDEDIEGTVIGISQAELAGLVGTSRETVSQVMRQLRRRGIALTGRQKITVCDTAKLSQVATGERILS
jgi:CRP/FNR family transcriptional regulator, cyclic AMP receptor protein